MEGIRKRPWSDLPPELLCMINSRLQTRMDVLRFRSVCSSFRSSIPLPAPRFPFRVPSLWSHNLFLHERTVYAIEKPADKAASGRERRLLKLEESELGDMRVFSLFSRRLRSLPRKFPELLDSLQSRVEICREYTLELGHDGTEAAKVVVHPHPDCALDQCVIYFIDFSRQLWYCKYGDEDWTHLGCGCDDIEFYQGRVWVVHLSGLVSWIDSSFKLGTFSLLPIDTGNHWTRLVVSSGDLYAVVMCLNPSITWVRGLSDLRAYKLDQQCGGWKEVRSLGNSAFFLCNHCSFAVPARELGWCHGNCIYYASNSFSYSYGGEIMAFSLADRKHKCVKVSGFVGR